MIEEPQHPRSDGLVERLHVGDEAGPRVGLARHRHLEAVVVPVRLRVRALAVDPSILGVVPLRIGEPVGRGERVGARDLHGTPFAAVGPETVVLGDADAEEPRLFEA